LRWAFFRAAAVDQPMTEALATAVKIAEPSSPVVIAAKRAINEALELPLADGLRHERAAFYNCFDTADQKEGMTAFLAKQQTAFVHR
jgi:enoyl-CoA hydratase